MNNNSVRFIQIGSIMMILSVALGAFGAHALKNVLDDSMIKVYNTAVEYQFYHSLVLLLIAFILHLNNNNKIKLAGYLMFASTIIFSGSLYVMTITDIKWLGAITPIGGTGFIISWFLIALNIKNKE